MDENKLSKDQQRETCNNIDKKTDELRAILVGLIAIGLDASKGNSDCFTSPDQASDILQRFGLMADKIQEEIHQLTSDLFDSID